MPIGFSGVNNVQEPESSFVLAKPQSKKRSVEDKLADLAATETLNKQIKQTKTKRDKEKQFNRKRELNDQLKDLKMRLAKLRHG